MVGCLGSEGYIKMPRAHVLWSASELRLVSVDVMKWSMVKSSSKWLETKSETKLDSGLVKHGMQNQRHERVGEW